LSKSKRTAHYIFSTHWDREWYQSFQEFRFRLVSMMDEILDTMKTNQDFRYFQTDGQSIFIEDYLEIRPERQSDIRNLAKEGRIRIGPWYVSPDEFIVCGESLVRNLQIGMEVASKFGQPSRVGFVCDIFGHTSQLPQILRGFGIDNAFLSRGTTKKEHGAVWLWQSPDGSEVITYRFGHGMGYSSYATDVRRAIRPDEPFDLNKANEALSNIIEQEKEYCKTPSFILFDGADHMELEPQTLQLLKKQNKSRNDVEIIYSHLEAFVEDLREQREHIDKTFVGELRKPQKTDDDIPLITGVLSSRIPLKQANARCENELCLWAEPFSAFTHNIDRPYPHRFLHTAWRYLLQNHPHDSICSCSIDQVHKDMEYRFDQSIQISRHVTSDALCFIALKAERPKLGENDTAIVVFNASAEKIDDTVDVTLQFPHDINSVFFEGFGYEDKISFQLFDCRENEIPYQLVNQRFERVTFRRLQKKFPTKHVHHEVDITIPLKIPAYGYTTFVCRPAQKGKPTRYAGSMLVDDHTMENEYLRASILPNGTLQLIDKRNNQTYENLLTFEDRSDIGDGWYHASAVNDQVFSSAASGADIAVVADGIAKTTLKSVVTMNVPASFDADNMVRDKKTAFLKITNLITLRPKADHVEIKTIVENNVRDHRLRVLFPTGTKAETYFADGAYDVIERPIKLNPDYNLYHEMETETKPQYTWTAVHDPKQTKRGLAVISTGLPESAVRDLPDRTIALTLLRSFFKTVHTNGEEGAEIQGTHEFNYAITPLNEKLPRTRLCRLGQLLASPPRSVQLESRDINDTPTTLPATYSFIKTPPKQAVVTAIRRRENSTSLILRMFNPNEEPITESIELNQKVQSAEQTDLEGNVINKISISDNIIKIKIKSKQIVTLTMN